MGFNSSGPQSNRFTVKLESKAFGHASNTFNA